MSNIYEEKERQIREKRMIQATRENMMGASGKLGCIVKTLGDKIIRQSTSNSSYLDDPYEVYDENQIETLDDDGCIHEGYNFDGLSRGYHLTITYMLNDAELTVYYKGYMVYKEISGDLYCYAPFDDWIKIIENLFDKSQTKIEQNKLLYNEEKEKSFLEMSKFYIQKLRMQWGI